MRVERIPTLGDNYTYLIIDPASNEAAVVDAPEAGPVVARVEALGVNLTKVLSTHHHWDHSAANPELAERYRAPVFGHASDAQRIPGFTHGLEEGDRVSVGALEAEIIFIPAHTRGHIAYVFAEAVFCGHEYTESNLRFALSVEPSNTAAQKKMEWVRERRSKAASDWHDATEAEFSIPSTIGEEKATNPFMRVDSPELIESVRKVYPGAAADPVTILGHVRAMKDTF